MADFQLKLPIAGAGLSQKEAQAEIYDRQHSEDEQSRRHYGHSIWFPLYREVCRQLDAAPHGQILEVGCGTGAFAHCVLEHLAMPYRGFDFSSVAVQQAQRRTGCADCFFVGDARAAASYSRAYDTIVCLEVLEHIERDLDVIAHWRPRCECICSVPNFDYETHVRWFRNEQDIVSRYGHLISLRHICRIRCPLVRGRGWRPYLRQLRWSRNNPRRLMGLLGYRTFENFAGWFLFCGTRR
jgi:2-polyprenyl-3-methyl-5-hydroxy-6-metoxy-1,4-benzoquinol methylase